MRLKGGILRTLMHRTFLLIGLLFFSLFVLPVAKAQAEDCPIIYGGGKIDCSKPTPTTTPVPAQKLPTTTVKQTQTLPAQTKGGLPIQQPAPLKTTPATGPEALGLIGLIPAAATGLWLRRKK